MRVVAASAVALVAIPPARKQSSHNHSSSSPADSVAAANAGSSSGGRSAVKTTPSLVTSARLGGATVGEDQHAVSDGSRVDELEPLRVVRFAEQALTAPEHDGEYHQPQLVDEISLQQRLREHGTSVHDHISLVLSLQPPDACVEVALEHGGVAPVEVVERGGDHVLGHRVELVCELTVTCRPRLGEPLVRDAPEQLRVRGHRLLQLERHALTRVDLERPAAVPEALGAARILHHAVEGNELGYDDVAHRYLLVADDPGNLFKQMVAKP